MGSRRARGTSAASEWGFGSAPPGINGARGQMVQKRADTQAGVKRAPTRRPAA
jgi:hypothetical protein